MGLIFLGLLAAKAVSGSSAGEAEKRLTWLQRAAYTLIVGLVVLNAYNLGNDIAAANYAWASQRNLAQSQTEKAYSNALRAVQLRPGVTLYWRVSPTPSLPSISSPRWSPTFPSYSRWVAES